MSKHTFMYVDMSIQDRRFGPSSALLHVTTAVGSHRLPDRVRSAGIAIAGVTRPGGLLDGVESVTRGLPVHAPVERMGRSRHTFLQLVSDNIPTIVVE
jgi:hypothetical protein